LKKLLKGKMNMRNIIQYISAEIGIESPSLLEVKPAKITEHLVRIP
jgi:hypothetical protein